MSKKLVWLGIVVVLVVIMAIRPTSAYTDGFVYSDLYCGQYLEPVMSGQDFENSFLYYYTNGGFSSGHDVTTEKPSGMRLVYLDWVADNTNCIERTFFSDERYGMFLYTYMYLLKPVSVVNMEVWSCTSDNKAFVTNTGLMFYRLDNTPGFPSNLDDKGTNFESLLRNVGTAPIYPSSTVSDDDGGYFYFPKDCNKVNFVDSSVSLAPGLYFVTVGIASHPTDTYQHAKKVGGGLQFKFNDYAGAFSTTVGTSSNPFYGMFQAPLKDTEINQKFGAYVENTSWLCHAAGGKMFTESNLGITSENFESFKSSFSTYNPGKQFDMTHLCCGNTYENYYFNYPDENGVIETIRCFDKEWTKNSEAGACLELIATNTEWEDHSNNNYIWEDLMNLYNLEPFQIDSGRTDGSDGCCGDDYPPASGYGDYGYIGTVDEYDRFLCYDSNIDPTYPQFGWLDAFDDRYLIKTMNKGPSKPYNSVDLISNSENWYYCNANGKNLFNAGTQIPEYGTFGNVNIDDTMACSDIATIIYFKDNPILYETCDSEDYNSITNFPCCSDEVPVSIFTPNDCVDQCYDALGTSISTYSEATLCRDFTLGCALTSMDDDPTDSELDKSSCPSDPDSISCLNVFASNPALACKDQVLKPGNNYSVCTSSQLCGNGTFVASTETNENDRCCVGIKTYCKDVEEVIPTQNDCLAQFGKVYSREQYDCRMPGGTPIGNSGLSCCFGTLTPTASFSAQLRTAVVKNTSFICFSQENQDVISNCCYDKNCKNIDLVQSGKIRDGDNRIQALGGAFHTLENFDVVRDGMIIDRIKKFEIPETSSILYKDIPTNKLNLSQFSYLEFDIEYNIPFNISINNYNMGPLSQYLTNGDSPSRRHHAVIPILKDETGKPLAGDIVSKIRLVAHNKPAQFLIDNIILTPEGTDLQYNSKNYYCTGGFEGWISDLDPPTTWTNAQLQDWMQYGTYAMTCNSQSAFGWTGTMCCGDDTKMNYGEFYNDTLYGCFNGTIVKNDWSMGYAKNYYESTIENDQLEDYEYAGIMYYNNAFIGCQIPNGDAELSVSRYGTPGAPSLVNNITNVQCAVVGKYHCDDGVWRQLIATDRGEKTFPEGNISLKYAPQGAELIKIGFRPGELSAQTNDIPEGVAAESPPPVEQPGESGEIVEPVIAPVVDDEDLVNVPSCGDDQIPCDGVCEPKFKDCTRTISYATSAYQTGTCTGTTVNYGTCTLYSCMTGYKVMGDDCIRLLRLPVDDGGGSGDNFARMT